jgi:hypothetical protein
MKPTCSTTIKHLDLVSVSTVYSFPNATQLNDEIRQNGGCQMMDGARSGNSQLSSSAYLRAPNARNSALAFTEGVRAGWLASDFIAWTREHLVLQGRVTPPFGSNITQVREPGFGVVLLSDHAVIPSDAGPVLPLAELSGLLSFARDRVLDQLRQAVSTCQTRFVQAAIYGERIMRTRVDGRSQWRAQLSESTALRDQVLALFAVDALENPADYEQDLAVCDACGSVTLCQDLACARGCPAHPYGTLETSKARHTGTRSGIVQKKP